MTLNQQFANRLSKLGITIPEILMPAASVNLQRWSVVACDQYTSDQAYWQQVEALVGNEPSSLRLTLPEIHLEKPDVASRITAIHAAMKDYQSRAVLENQGPSLMYIERTTKASGLRQGLVLAMDLECYSYAPNSTTLIRATEGTIIDRIPPRLAVRRTADLELPHIMILIQDPTQKVIEGLATRKSAFKPAYDLELMQQGGHLAGWKIDAPAEIENVLKNLETLLVQTKTTQNTETPLFWAMGDGNHSLATAKARWEEIKAAHLQTHTDLSALADHPARFALAEIVNIYSPGLRFEPIHRTVFTNQADEMIEMLAQSSEIESFVTIQESELVDLLGKPDGQKVIGCFDGKTWKLARLRADSSRLPPAVVDLAFTEFHKQFDNARIDFIHGWQDNRKLADEGAVCFFLPVIAREHLFDYVQNNGPLPRKAFSMGEAEEKRYYLEARRITR